MKSQIQTGMMNLTLKDADYTKKSIYEENFSFKKKLQDPRFGDISIIQNPKTREVFAVVEKKINDKKAAGNAIVNARRRLQNSHPNLLSLKDYSVQKQSELCSSFYIIKEFYEYPKSDLNREFELREKEGVGFDDKELTHILYQQISANAYLQSKDLSHGDVQPFNIAYDKALSESKLIDKSSDGYVPQQQLNLQKNKVIGNHKLFQSPTMYQNLKKGNLNFQYNKNKEDMYGLGLSLLQLGNGKSIQNVYDKTKGEVDQTALQNHVKEFDNKFGHDNSLLVSTVSSMLNPNENDRPDFRTLQSQMPDYEEVKKFLKTNPNSNNLNTNNQGFNINNTNNFNVNKTEAKKTDFNDDLFNFDSGIPNNKIQGGNFQLETQTFDQYPLIQVPQVQKSQAQPFDDVNPYIVNSNIQQPVFNHSSNNHQVQSTPQDSWNQSYTNNYSNSNLNNNTYQDETYHFNNNFNKSDHYVQNTPTNFSKNPNQIVESHSYTTQYAPEPIVRTQYVQAPEVRNTEQYSYVVKDGQYNSYSEPQISHYSDNSRTYSTNVSQTKREVIQLEPEYRTEYISKVDVEAEKRKYSTNLSPIKTSETVVYTQPNTQTIYQQPTTVYTQPNTTVYTQPTTTVYTQPSNTVYTQPTTTVYQQQPQQSNIVYQQPTTTTVYQQQTQPTTTYYQQPNQVIYSTPQINTYEGYTSNSYMPVENNVNTRISSVKNFTSQNVSGLKLVRTYEDSSRSKM